MTDWTEKRPHGRGKQKIEKKGKYASLFYMPQSGIWKTVWMESVEEDYIQELKSTPMFNENAVRISIQAAQGGKTAHITVLGGETDPDRLVNEACGWFDQKGGDMHSIHNYIHRLKVKPQKDRVVVLTEYGGYAYPVKSHLACEKEFGYRHYHSAEELTANYKRLWEEEIFPNLERGLSSAIYTQTSDIEEEINGLMTYDREVDKMVVEEVREINRRLYERFGEVTG